MAKDCTPPPHHVAYVNQLRAERGSTPPRQQAAAPPHRAAPVAAAPPPGPAAAPQRAADTAAVGGVQERKVKLIISVDGYRSYLNDCEVTVVLKQEGNYLPPNPGKMKADPSGDIKYDEWTLSGKNCFIIARVMPSLCDLDGRTRVIPPGVAIPYEKRGVIPDNATGTIWFKLGPRLKARSVDVSVENNDSTNRGSTSTTDKGSGSLSYGIATLSGEHSVTENSPSLTDGSKRTMTEHHSIDDVTGIELEFSPTPPIISADAGAPSTSGFA